MEIIIFAVLALLVSFGLGRKTEGFVRRRDFGHRQGKVWMNAWREDFTVLSWVLIGVAVVAGLLTKVL